MKEKQRERESIACESEKGKDEEDREEGEVRHALLPWEETERVVYLLGEEEGLEMFACFCVFGGVDDDVYGNVGEEESVCVCGASGREL